MFEYYDDDDYLGHSVEDNYCVSPGTAAQFTFNRDRDVNFASYMGQEKIPEEEENESEGEPGTLNDSGGGQIKSRLNDLEQGKLNSCLEEVRNVLGDTVPEHIMCQAIVKNNFHLEASLNELLTPQAAPKPQRQPRVNRRNRSQGDDDEDDLDNFMESLESESPKKMPCIPSHNITFDQASQQTDLSLCQKIFLENSSKSEVLDKIDHADSDSGDTVLKKEMDKRNFIANVTAPKNAQSRLFTQGSTHNNESPICNARNVSLASLAKQTPPNTSLQSLALMQGKVSNIPPNSLAGQREGNASSKVSLADLAKQSQKKSLADLADEKQSPQGIKPHSRPTVDSKANSVVCLNDLAKEKNQCVQKQDLCKSKTLVQSTNTSLADLAKQQGVGVPKQDGRKPMISQMQSGLSLADLAKKHQTKTRDGTCLGLSLKELSLEPKQAVSVLESNEKELHSDKQLVGIPAIPKISLADLASVKKPLSSKVSVKNLAVRDATNKEKANEEHQDISDSKKLDRSDSLMEQVRDQLIIMCLDTGEEENVGNLHIIQPSILGKTISLKNNKNLPVYPRKSEFPKFSCKNQIRGILNASPQCKKELVPFDFLSPSPDDIVKQRQKAAFTRTGS